MLTSVTLGNFKRIKKAEITLAPVNVLVGGNNSGKSSILQGIHFSVMAALAARALDQQTFPQEVLLYCPADDFTYLRHGRSYRNREGDAESYLKIGWEDEEGNISEYIIRIYRGRNHGNIGCKRSGPAQLAALIGSRRDLFSIYVPGLAGVPQREEYRTHRVVRRGVASGDANLYLRNVLLQIEEKDKTHDLIEWVRTIFPGFHLETSFDKEEDINVNVSVYVENKKVPLELAGTGVQQALQIFSYVTLFNPSLLLLDEPDSHLHPDNQLLLANTLQSITNNTDTKILLSTHSRHLVDALYNDASLIWVKGGDIKEQGINLPRIPLLMDIGALDSFDKLINGTIQAVVLTEDSKKKMLQNLLKYNGFDMKKTIVYSYRTSSNIEGALTLASFIKNNAPDSHIIIHRDRDFMTNEEVQRVVDKIETAGATPFVTELCDIESYYCSTSHLASVLGVDEKEIEQWKNDLASKNHIALQHAFTRKRDDIMYSMYKGKREDCPDTRTLLGTDVPLSEPKRLGKKMLSLINGSMFERFGVRRDLIGDSKGLKFPELSKLAVGVFGGNQTQ